MINENVQRSLKSGENSSTHDNNEFSWKKDLLAPAILVLFAGIVGIGIGYFWEFFQFKRQTLFETRINLISDSRKQAGEIFVEFDRLRRQIFQNEKDLKAQHDRDNRICNPNNLRSEIEELKSVGLRLEYLSTFSKGVMSNDKELAKSLESFSGESGELRSYLECLENNNTCEICTGKHPKFMNPLNEIIEHHNKEIISQIQ